MHKGACFLPGFLQWRLMALRFYCSKGPSFEALAGRNAAGTAQEQVAASKALLGQAGAFPVTYGVGI